MFLSLQICSCEGSLHLYDVFYAKSAGGNKGLRIIQGRRENLFPAGHLLPVGRKACVLITVLFCNLHTEGWQPQSGCKQGLAYFMYALLFRSLPRLPLVLAKLLCTKPGRAFCNETAPVRSKLCCLEYFSRDFSLIFSQLEWRLFCLYLNMYNES